MPVWYKQTPTGRELRIELGLDRHGRDLWLIKVEGGPAEVEDVSLPRALAQAVQADPTDIWLREIAGAIEGERRR